MKKKLSFTTILVVSVILTLGLSISFQSLLADWVAPTANPPAGGMNEKIISSSYLGDFQSIVGGLGIGQNFSVDIANETFYVDASNHRVGIGTISPSFDLHVSGTSYALNGLFGDMTVEEDFVVDPDDDTFVVDADSGRVGILTATPSTNLDVNGDIRVRNITNCNTGNGNGVIETDLNGNLQCGTDNINDADSDSSNEIQGVLANQGLRVSSDDFGLVTCSNGQILKSNGSSWSCASDSVGTVTSLPASSITVGTFGTGVGTYIFDSNLTVNGKLDVEVYNSGNTYYCYGTACPTISGNSYMRARCPASHPTAIGGNCNYTGNLSVTGLTNSNGYLYDEDEYMCICRRDGNGYCVARVYCI